jgi:hypothetical protein
MAVGDNLLSSSLAADLMRLNKSFVVERSVAGARAQYQALSRTSRYMQQSLQQGISVWIAQRQGRAKDGFDRTDPALLKMLLLAYRDKTTADLPMERMLQMAPAVPVSVSYELDPCGPSKAHELAVIDQQGVYEKSPQEDLNSMVKGLMGHKGRLSSTKVLWRTHNFTQRTGTPRWCWKTVQRKSWKIIRRYNISQRSFMLCRQMSGHICCDSTRIFGVIATN